MIKYGYVVFPTNSGRNGYLTVAVQRPEKNSTSKKYYASFAFCSPSDSFSKKIGRAISTGKLVSGKSQIEFEANDNWHDILNAAFEQYISNNKLPSWVSKSIRKGTWRFGLGVDSIKDSFANLLKTCDAHSLKILADMALRELDSR